MSQSTSGPIVSEMYTLTYVCSLDYQWDRNRSECINNKAIPNMTVGPDSSFVNFITLAESVALAPIVDFGTSLGVFSVFGFEDFNLLAVAVLFGLPVPSSSS